MPKITNEYNNIVHSSTKLKPEDVYLHHKRTFEETKDDKKDEEKFKVNDYVRVSLVKRTFEKGYTHRWSKEVFKIVNVWLTQSTV